MTPDAELAEARLALRSMEEQLVALYDERTHEGDLALMVASLEAQVCALVDEKAELERELARLRGARAAA